MIKLGLLGVGKMGQNHLKNIVSLPCYELSFIYDYNDELCARLAKEYGTKASLDLDKGLASVDAIIIVTPTFTHDEYIKKVSKATKNIFVEKPLCDNFEKCQEIMLLEQNLGLNIALGFIERFNPALKELQNELKKLDSNTHELRFTRTSLASLRISDVDVITDLMIHDIDLALYLNGDAQVLFANGIIQNNTINLATATLKHENGIISHIHASRITHKNERKISISADEAHFECDLLAKELTVFKNAKNVFFGETESFYPARVLFVRRSERGGCMPRSVSGGGTVQYRAPFGKNGFSVVIDVLVHSDVPDYKGLVLHIS